MIVQPWEFLLLALAAYRITRLVGWDDLPPVERAREWLLGEESYDGETFYRRPLLAHLVHCPFCVGWWISLTIFGCWLLLPTATLVAATPFALSGVVGLIAKVLDA